MSKLVKVKNYADLKKDVGTNAVLNTNASELELYKLRRKKIRSKDQKIEDLEVKVEKILNILEKMVGITDDGK